jgi:hypothetical protein
MSLSLPIPNAHFIWYCAWLSIPSAIYAYNHTATTHYTTVPTAVFATSLNYWRNPLRDSWRRTLDIAVVFSGVSYQSYYAFQTTSSSTFTAYSILIAISTACYMISNYLLTCGKIWPATYAHASIHVFANVANIVLYSGT